MTVMSKSSKMTKKTQKQQKSSSSEIELKVVCYMIKTVAFGKIYGFCDVTGNFELDFRTISWLYLAAASDFPSPFFSELFFSDEYPR